MGQKKKRLHLTTTRNLKVKSHNFISIIISKWALVNQHPQPRILIKDKNCLGFVYWIN